MSDPYEDDRPRTVLHPPTVMMIALTSGFLLRVFFGGYLPLPRAFAEGVGGLMVIFALGVFTAAVSAFAAGGEALKPDTPSKQLFVNGPYRFSRNPIYLAMMLFGIGFGVATSNLWIILTTALSGLLFHFFVILPEERYLEDKFGPEYETYKNAVRRWI